MPKQPNSFLTVSTAKSLLGPPRNRPKADGSKWWVTVRGKTFVFPAGLSKPPNLEDCNKRATCTWREYAANYLLLVQTHWSVLLPKYKIIPVSV
jgi:hypothetical protein